VPKRKGPFPVLFLNHGFIDPSIYTNGRGLKREQDFLVRNGYVVIHSDYRGHADSDSIPQNGDIQGLGYDGYTTDILNAITAVSKSNLPYIDSSRVGMLGHSMGGGITLNVLVSHPELVKAAVLFAPVSSDYHDNFQRWRKKEVLDEGLQEIAGKIGSVDSSQSFQAFSSLTYFGRIDDPVMIHHGSNDEDVPIEWSHKTKDALKSAGKEATLYIYPEELHEFVEAWAVVMQRTLEFFDKNVKNS